MQAKTANNVKIIDVSHHQTDRGPIDWQKVKAASVAGAFVKATEGGSIIDKAFVTNVAGASSAGLKVGVYHYAHPELNTPASEAAHFVKTVAGIKVDFPYVLDVEGDAANVPSSELTAWCKEWLETVVEITGHPTMIYSGASFAHSLLGKQLAPWPLWVAHYEVDKPLDNGTWDKWSVFQYTATSTISGILGNVDVNAMEQAFYDKYAGNVAEPRPSSVDNIKVVVNDKLTAYGRIIDGHVYLPLRQLGEALGVTVEWRAESTPFIAGKIVTPFRLIDGRTYIGVRAAAELLSGVVSFDGQTKKVFFYK